MAKVAANFAVGTDNFYAGVRHFAEIAGNFDQKPTPNSAQVPANSSSKLPPTPMWEVATSPKLPSTSPRVTLNFVKVAHNFDRVTHNFDRGSHSANQ